MNSLLFLLRLVISNNIYLKKKKRKFGHNKGTKRELLK